MSKILIFSDTHGNVNDAIHIIRSSADLDMFFHLGDHIDDAHMIHKRTKLPYEAVAGNMDMPMSDPRIKIVDIESVKVLLTHGDKFKVNSGILMLEKEAEARNADIVCFGHTHRAFEEWKGKRLFLNPGSLLGDRKTFGILKINGDKVEYSLGHF